MRAWLAATVSLTACASILSINDLTPVTAPTDASSRDQEADGALAAEDAEAGGGAVGDGGADASTDASATCDANADPDNCGRCGHSCLGGQCLSGRCQPVAIATGQGTIAALTLDATHVYFTSLSNNTVARVAKTGGAVQPYAGAPDVATPKRIAVNGQHVYWANSDLPSWISRCPLAGCGGSPYPLPLTATEVTGLALSATHVAWVDRNGERIARLPLDGGSVETLVDTNGTSGLPVTLALGAGSLVFWIADFSGEVHRSNPADGGRIAMGATGPIGREIALDATHVYWAAAHDVGELGSVGRAPRDGGPVETVGPAMGDPRGLVVEGSEVYWTAWRQTSTGQPVDGGVYVCPVTGCGGTPTPLASGLDLPRAIALDGTAIYFGTNGAVMKLARP